MSNNLRWYVLNTYSGYELQARSSLLKRIENDNMGEHFGEPTEESILVPSEDVESMVAGKARVRKRKFFPGYMLIQMKWSPKAATFVRAIPKVIGFLGASKNDLGKAPRPISQHEADRLLGQITEGTSRPKRRLEIKAGDAISVVDGPFKSFTGVVEEVYEERERLRVSFDILGRPTPVELEFVQVTLDSGGDASS